MSIHAKTLYLLSIALLGLLLSILACTHLTLLRDNLQLERVHTLKDARRTHSFVLDEVQNLDELARYWTGRHDLRALLRNGNAAGAGLPDSTIVGFDLDLFLIRDAAGQVVFNRGIDPLSRKVVATSAAMMTALARYRSLDVETPARRPKAVAGIVLAPWGPMLVAMRSIAGDDPRAPSRGSLLIGRCFGAEETGRCSILTNLEQALYSFAAADAPDDVRRTQKRLSRTFADTTVCPLDAQTIAGYAAFNDLNGDPAFLLRFASVRDIYQDGLRSRRYLLLVITLLGACFGLSIMLLVERLVLRPLSALQTGVSRIGQGSDPASSLPVRDPARSYNKFDNLTDAVHRMLAELETAHQQTLTALRDGEARLTTILNSINTGVLILDMETCAIIEANQFACRLIGSSPTGLVGMAYTDFIQADKPADILSAGSSEQILKRADGSMLPVLLEIAPITLNGKRRLVTSLVDISTLKQVERKLIEREHHLSALVRAHQHLLFASPSEDDATCFTEVLGLLGRASYACRTSLYTFDNGSGSEPVMRRLAAWHAPGVSAEPSPFTLFPRWRDALSRGEQIAGDTVTFPADEVASLAIRGVVSFCLLPLLHGERLTGFVSFEQCGAENAWDEATYDLLRVAAGALALLWEQRQAQRALWQSENRYRLLFNSGNDMIFVNYLVQAEGRHRIGAYIEVNDVACRELDYSRDELCRLPLSEIEESPNDEETALPALSRIYDTVYRTRDGRLIPAEASQHVFELDGHPVLLTIARDLTERRRADEQIKQIIADLSRSNEELQLFAYIASHDLQEPLRMVANYMELLARRYQGQLDERAHKYITYAVDGATRMQEMIEALLMYSRVGTQGKPVEPVALDEVLGAALQNLRISISEANAEITHDALPVVMADRGQLTQLFQNLIANALKFHGEAPPSVHIAAERHGAEWQLAVRDNGIGIDARYAERIFGMFQRLHSRRDYPGTGIGLAICKKIVERHGGRIWVETQLGEGSTFYFTLPGGGEKSA